MVINLKLSRKRKPSKKKSSKFLLLPLYFNGNLYWLERVIIRKNYTGYRYKTTDVRKFVKISENEFRQSNTDKKNLLREVV